jgi:DNA-binding response OmpR family regulator
MKKILIIEDDLIVANIYRNKLAVDGFQVEIANDAETGFQLLKNFRPDVILLDLMLPKMPGIEVLKKIRATPEFEKLPVIVFSSTYLTNVVQEAWKAGATKCLSKAACTPKEIIEAVRGALQMSPSSPTYDGQTSITKKPSAPAAAPNANLNSLFQNEIQKTFIESLPSTITSFRALLQKIIKAENELSRLDNICDLCRRVHALTGNAGIAGAAQIAQMSDALEVLLRELYEKPENINPSTLRTVAAGVDFLGILFSRAATPGKPASLANIIAVDDDPISLRAVTFALEKAKLKAVGVQDPTKALTLLSEQKFDLVFLDVDMPEMSGFELCTKLRTGQVNKKTPVVFVTNLNDFENRANSTMSGGNDFIGKPFMFIELAVKALLHVLRGQLELAKV